MFAVFLAGVPFCRAQEPPPAAATEASAAYVSPTESRLRADVTFLASDEREGRAPGSSGIEAAAKFIAETFKSLGLKTAPGADGYFQEFTLAGRPTLGAANDLAIHTQNGKELRAELKTSYTPLAIGSSGSAEKMAIVFAGYGITARDEKTGLDYDDYAGIDVKGKAVLIIRREPQQDREDSPFNGRKTSEYATFRHKATNAFQHGAAMVLLVNDLAGLEGGKDNLLGLVQVRREEDTSSKLPFVMVTRDFADQILAAAGSPKLADIEARIDSDLRPRSRELQGVSVTARVTIDRPGITTRNVVGVLEGSGPLADETIVIGGHYDHLGRGGLLSGSLAVLSSEIHNGADDNASGTATVLEMARRLSTRRDPLPRRVVFIAFSGEEKGLLGSQYYVDHPLFPLNKTVMMINFDMVGRLNLKRELTMIGTGTSPGSEFVVEALGKSSGLTIKKVTGLTDGFGGSDHQSFYAKDVPVLFAFTGVHPDYHRPSDDSDRINYGGMARICDYMELLALDLIRRPERPAFARLNPPRRESAQSGSVAMGATLGVMPDYGDEAKEGMKLSGVRDGGPAAKAGLKGGDVITSIENKKIATIYDYMESLKGYKPGQKIHVGVRRGGEDLKIEAELGGTTGASHKQ
ncbi:M28 family peptidase [Aquisphaera insulae]|uniref:M28 family peptidase n=1 Tax=Aquisphaera insulae TaxID=2712864 RepID=UPI0013EB2CFD|nr:M28 family peptidase [Aquisphaera insulae]